MASPQLENLSVQQRHWADNLKTGDKVLWRGAGGKEIRVVSRVTRTLVFVWDGEYPEPYRKATSRKRYSGLFGSGIFPLVPLVPLEEVPHG